MRYFAYKNTKIRIVCALTYYALKPIQRTRHMQISERIDGCERLIAQKAHVAYARLDVNDKRWIDIEDVLQEGRLMAVDAESSYLDVRFVKRGGAAKPTTKYSTWLWGVLERRFINYNSRFQQMKRVTPSLIELDAPLPDGEAREVPSAPTQYDTVAHLDLVDAFMQLCAALNEPAIVVLVRGLLFANVYGLSANTAICADIGVHAKELGISWSDLAVVGGCENTRKKVLTRISRSGMISEGGEEALRLLQCTECGGKFSIGAIRDQRFYVDSMTCRACYKGMQQTPSEVSCFGKPKSLDAEGYAAADNECRLHCRDRTVCAKFSKELTIMKNAAADVEDVDFADVEVPAKSAPAEGNGKKAKPAAAKNGKKAKPAEEKPAKKDTKKAKSDDKPAKAKKEKDEDPAPKEVGEWPYRRGSAMDYIFRQMLKGVGKKAIEKEVTAAGNSWPNMLKIMQRPNHRCHTWKLNEEGSQYKIFDIKFLGSTPKAKK